MAERLIVKNPIEEYKAPPIRRKEMQLLTREELQRLLIQEPKTKASIRTVILPPPVVETLKEYKKTVSSR